MINVFDIKTNKMISQLQVHQSRIYSLVALNIGEIWCASDDGSISILDASKCKVLKPISQSSSEFSVKSLLVIDERTVWSLVSTLNDSKIVSWNSFDLKSLNTVKVEEPSACMCMIKKHGLVWIGGLTKIFVVFMKTLKLVGHFNAHSSKISSIVLTSQEQVWCTSDKSITVWNPNKVDTIAVLNEHETKVLSLCSCGDYVCSGAAKIVMIWDSKSFACLMKIPSHEDAVTAIVFDSNTSLMYSGSFDRSIQIWKVGAPIEEKKEQKQEEEEKKEEEPAPPPDDRIAALLNSKLQGSKLSSSGRKTVGYKKDLKQ